jgi:hypothetical protein
MTMTMTTAMIERRLRDCRVLSMASHVGFHDRIKKVPG